jgi:short-subunit dehydrogenase
VNVSIIGNGGVSKGFQEMFMDLKQDFDLYQRATGDLYEMPNKINKKYDLIIYAVGDIIWKRIKDITLEDIEKVFKPNAFGFFILAKVLSQTLDEKGKVLIIGANIDRVTFPFLSLYSASKAALRTFVDVCKTEMQLISFYLIEPDEIDTPLRKKIPIKPGNPKSPKDFARETLILIDFFAS